MLLDEKGGAATRMAKRCAPPGALMGPDGARIFKSPVFSLKKHVGGLGLRGVVAEPGFAGFRGFGLTQRPRRGWERGKNFFG